ncbi:MAG: pentapeptide repeat-containing protein [Bacteroidota bacterium]
MKAHDTMTFENVTIYDNVKESFDVKRGINILSSSLDPIQNAIVRAPLKFTNVTFEDIGQFNLITFQQNVLFEKCIIKGLYFNKCRFINGLFFANCRDRGMVFGDCIFESLKNGDVGYSEINIDNLEESISSRRMFYNCRFINSPLFSGSSGEKSFTFQECVFEANAAMVSLVNQQCRSIKFSDCRFFCDVQLANLNITGKFSVLNCYFKKFIEIRDVSYDEKTSGIDYESVRHRVTSAIEDHVAYIPDNKKNISNTGNYKALMTTLYNLHSLLKSHGDIKAANSVYIDIRDYETHLLWDSYNQHPTLKTFFAWKMNRFLKFFCQYGTDPVQSLYYAFFTILFFSLLYFIFPSETDNLSTKRMVPAFEKLLSRAGVLEDETVKQPPFSAETGRLKALLDLTNSHKDVLPQPLYTVGHVMLKATFVYFSYLNKIKVPYPTVSEGRKHTRQWTIYTFAYLFWFLLTGLLMRLLNALALSVNAFVTLGYGEMQAKGAARYLVVLEGAIGWFLLGIFSVSLISQILG